MISNLRAFGARTRPSSLLLTPLGTVLLWASLAGSLQAQDEPGHVAGKRERKSERGWGVVASLGSGLGQFQDIQVPVNEEAQVRGDGKAVMSENANHLGVPFTAALAAQWRSHRLVSDVGADFVLMRATTGPVETQSSSYSRASLGAGVRWSLFEPESSSYAPYLGGRIETRRSAYNNVSTGHYVSALVTRAELGFKLAGVLVEGFGSFAPIADFGYNTGVGFSGGKRFRGATTSLMEAGVRCSWQVTDAVALDLGAESEMVRVHIKDVAEYDSFGLNVGPSSQPERTYNLSTSMMKLGVRKSF